MTVHGPTLAHAVGALLRLWRWQACMSLNQVADAMGSHRPIVGRLESGMLALADVWHGFEGSSVPNELHYES